MLLIVMESENYGFWADKHPLQHENITITANSTWILNKSSSLKLSFLNPFLFQTFKRNIQCLSLTKQQNSNKINSYI